MSGGILSFTGNSNGFRQAPLRSGVWAFKAGADIDGIRAMAMIGANTCGILG
ncbi:MAG: hypothetical protein ACKOUT_12760 [Novosphingobium sp.]